MNWPSGLRSLAWVCALSSAIPASGHAQGIPVDPVPIGVQQPAEFLNELLPAGFRATTRAGEEPKNIVSFVPSFVAVNGASIYSAALSWSNTVRLPIELNAAANALDLGSETKNGFAVDGKIHLYANDAVGTLSTRAAFQKTFDISSQQDYQLLGRLPLQWLKQAVSVGVTGGYRIINPEVGDDRTGFTIGSSIGWIPSPLARIQVSYQFRTDIVGEDNFTLTAIQSLANVPTQPTLILVGGKHRLLAVTLAIPFYSR